MSTSTPVTQGHGIETSPEQLSFVSEKVWTKLIFRFVALATKPTLTMRLGLCFRDRFFECHPADSW